MISRFRWIYIFQGGKVLGIVVFLLVALLGLSIAGIILLDTAVPAIVASGGLFVGWLLRRKVAYYGDDSDRAVAVILAVYALGWFVGYRLGWDNEIKLTLITAATVIVFSLKFWVASDPAWTLSGTDDPESDDV